MHQLRQSNEKTKKKKQRKKKFAFSLSHILTQSKQKEKRQLNFFGQIFFNSIIILFTNCCYVMLITFPVYLLRVVSGIIQ